MKITEPYQMLDEIKDDLKYVIGIDVTALESKNTFFGFNKENWKEYKLNDGTPMLVPEFFNTEKNEGVVYSSIQEEIKNLHPVLKCNQNVFSLMQLYDEKKLKRKNYAQKIV